MLSLTPKADRYRDFRDSVFEGGVQEVTLPGFDQPVSEVDLQSLWFAGAFGSAFTSVDGQPVRIVDFGEWNSGAGPDFTRCSVEIAGQRLNGDIELDPDARDWERHAHGGNPAYAEVVLHLFLHAPAERFFTRTCDHRQVVQIHLNAGMLAQDARPNRGLAAAHLGRCHAPLRLLSPESVQSLLEAAAQHRLQMKSQRLHRCVQAQGRAQAVYQALAQTLGYRNNRQPFTMLTQRLPLKQLLKRSSLEREALLFGISGFLGPFDTHAPMTRKYLGELWSEWWKHRAEAGRWLEPHHALRWKFTALRPGNHPQRRLGALAAILENWNKVSAALLDASLWSLASWTELMIGLQHEFWSQHYSLKSSPAKRPVALIGKTRVQEMLANVVYPLLMPERTRLWAEYLELPALLDNQKVRRAGLRLFGDRVLVDRLPKKLYHQQGLLQIYEDFCLEDNSACEKCSFPERLKTWAP